MENFTPLPALIGGLLLGASVVILLAFNGRIAGISGFVATLFTKTPGNKIGSALFILGLVVGAALFQNLASEPTMVDRNPYDLADIWRYTAFIAGGLFVGIGSQLGSGCTSGHGICGISRLSPRSIVATCTFMATAGITVFVIRAVTGG